MLTFAALVGIKYLLDWWSPIKFGSSLLIVRGVTRQTTDCISLKTRRNFLKSKKQGLRHEYTVSHINLFLSVLDLLYQAFLQDRKEKIFHLRTYFINGSGSCPLMM